MTTAVQVIFLLFGALLIGASKNQTHANSTKNILVMHCSLSD
ncbi:hypothetical protein PH197_06360 [Leuconostoc lactis]|nr:hypothetical protein [Leuconostoc lactis]WKY78881.1 hypothetical protein PH197_06360 [Leuconostoc lactis]